MKPKPPTKPAASFPAVQPNQPNGNGGNKRPNNYKNRAATIDKSDAVTHQIIPRAIAQAVAAVENDDISTASTARVGGSQKSKGAMQSNSMDFELDAEEVLAVEEKTNLNELSTASEPLQVTVQTVIDNAIQAALANMARYALDSMALTAVKSEKKVEVEVEEEEVYEPLPEPEMKVEAEVLAVIDAYSNETEEPVETVETEEYVEKEVPPVPANTVDYHDNSVSFSASASTKMKVTTTSHFPSVPVDKTTPASPLYRQLNPAFFPSKSTSEVVLGVPSVESMKSVKSAKVKGIEVEEEQSERVVPVVALASTSYEERQSERAAPVAVVASTSYDTSGAKEVEEDEEATVVPPPVAVKSASLDAKYDMAEDVSLSNGHEDSYSKEAFDEVRDAPSASRTNLVSRVKSRASAEEALDDSYSKEAFDEVRDEIPSASRAKLVSRAKSRASGDALDDSYNDDFESSQ